MDSLLHLAVKSNNISNVWKVMKERVDLNSINSIGDTPLHIAAKNHNLQIFEHIYRFGGNLKLTNMEGKTPLDYLNEREKVVFSKFWDRFHGMGAYEYKPKPEITHHFGANR